MSEFPLVGLLSLWEMSLPCRAKPHNIVAHAVRRSRIGVCLLRSFTAEMKRKFLPARQSTRMPSGSRPYSEGSEPRLGGTERRAVVPHSDNLVYISA